MASSSTVGHCSSNPNVRFASLQIGTFASFLEMVPVRRRNTRLGLRHTRLAHTLTKPLEVKRDFSPSSIEMGLKWLANTPRAFLFRSHNNSKFGFQTPLPGMEDRLNL